MSFRVLICRAEPGATRTAARLKAMGYRAIVEPVLTIEPLSAPGLAIAPGSHIAVSSPNGADRLAELVPHRQATIYATGDTTAEHSRTAGFENVLSARGDEGDLADLIARRLPKGAVLRHLANRAAGGSLAMRLGERGVAVQTHHIYRATPADRPGPALAALLSGTSSANKPDAVLIHSAAATRAILDFVPAGFTLPTIVVAISKQAVADAALRVVVAESPDESALLRALASAIPPLP